ncbi:MAG: glycosyltransferase family 2 protein, partial [Candidatus Omnitrophica bacterium]|nr:glycosyltransferase family 2 protein [Candidatus Omnitrophota bacterium]
MMKQPFFSVIIPTFNRKPFLRKCINSVLEQSYDNFEIIVIDDGSSDGTEELVTSCGDKRINYHYQRNHGVAHSRNRALSFSKGDFAAFLDSD